MSSKVRLVDLEKLWKPLFHDEISLAIESIISCGQFINGPEVKSFESMLEKYVGKHVIGVASGTAALECSLRALNIGYGDEVIVPANSYVATAFAVSNVGAVPVFCDVNINTWLVDWACIEQKLSDKTRAIIVVHMWGYIAPINDIKEGLINLSAKTGRKIYLIEDTAQAMGAKYRDMYVGSFGDAACFSFYPTKNLGCWGDGGAVRLTATEQASFIRSYINQGQISRNHHLYIGNNLRLDSIQAAILIVGLKYLSTWNKSRQTIASVYNNFLDNYSDFKNTRPVINIDTQPVYHLYPILVNNREGFIDLAKEKDVEIGIHYPKPIHLLDCYRQKVKLPNVEKIFNHIVSIPIHPNMSIGEIVIVLELLDEAINKNLLMH